MPGTSPINDTTMSSTQSMLTEPPNTSLRRAPSPSEAAAEEVQDATSPVEIASTGMASPASSGGSTAGGLALALPANARNGHAHQDGLRPFCSSTSGELKPLGGVLSNTPDEIWRKIVGFLSTEDLELFAGVHPRSFLWAHVAVRQ